ncbi:MAG TPA: HlyD family secretion protein [Chitinophagales bacterium]|nr:HlyD family secretion protein [Chitinophagales bacterium]HNM31608.1 HlyD family secretion protein [Chitinophagales bacterium]
MKNKNKHENEAKKNVFIPIIGAVLLVGALVFAYYKITYAMHNEDTENAQIECNIIPIAPRVQGYVSTIYIKDNQRVHKGDTLLILDDRDLKIKLEQAIIAAKSAGANVNVVKSNVLSADASASAVSTTVITAQAAIETAKANVEAAKVRVWNATENFKRYEKLFNETSATQAQYDAALAEKQSAEKQVAVLEKQVQVAQAQLKAAQQQASASHTQANGVSTQVNLAEVGTQQQQTNVDFAKLQLSYAYIIAPSDGFISKKNVQPGQLVNPGQILMSIVDDSQLWINANFKETQVERMKVGQEVTVKVDAYPDKTFKGKIESLQAATGSKFSLLPADNATGNFVKVVQRIPVRIALIDDKNDAYDLRAGMNVNVAVKVK